MKQAKALNKINWQSTKLGELVTVLRGVNYKKAMARKEPSKGLVPIVRATNIQGILDYDNLVYVPQKCVSDEQYLKEGDIVIAASSGSKAIVGKAARVEKDWEGGFGAFCFCIRPKVVDSSKFISYFMQTKEYRNRVSKLSAGVNINNLKALHIQETPINVPDVPEQKRIVEEIETQFTRLDAGVAALKRAQANLKRYRAAVLKAACEGKLVPTEAELAKKEGRSYETGEQLLQRILAERKKKWEAEQKKTGGKKKYVEPNGPDVSSLPKLPKGWAWATVEQVGITTTGFTPSKKHKKYFGGNIPFLKPTDLDAGYYVKEYRDSLTKAGAEVGRILPALSILVTCIGATIGKTGLARVACTTNQQINALTVCETLLLPKYIHWLIVSPFGQNQIINNASSTTLPILNKSRFESLLVKIPPYKEQLRIVEEVERMYSVIEAMSLSMAVNEKRSTKLKTTILNRFLME